MLRSIFFFNFNNFDVSTQLTVRSAVRTSCSQGGAESQGRQSFVTGGALALGKGGSLAFFEHFSEAKALNNF